MNRSLVFRCARCGVMNRVAILVSGRVPVCGRCKAELDTTGAAQDVDLAALERAVASSPVPVLIDFWAPWCGPCRAFAPVLERFAREEAGRLLVLRLDTEAHPAAGARFAVQAVPTIALFRDGKELERSSGAMPLAELRRFAAAAAYGVGA